MRRRCWVRGRQPTHIPFADVVRVHYLLTRKEDFEPIWPVLQTYFGDVRPACTVMVTGLVDDKMLIEIEVTALKAAD